MSREYEFFEDGSAGTLALTDRGRDFIEHEGGETEVFVDEQNVLAKFLALVANNGPTRAGGILEEWTEYPNRHPSFGTPSTVRKRTVERFSPSNRLCLRTSSGRHEHGRCTRT